MMSSAATSSPVSASTLAYLMRCPVLRLIWLNETFSVSEVAGYRATGQVTSERRKKPFQLARGAMGKTPTNATDEGSRIPSGEAVSNMMGRESDNGVNRGCSAALGPVTFWTARAAEWGGPKAGTSPAIRRWLRTGGVEAMAGITGTYGK